MHVFGDLLRQRFHRWKFDFGPQPLEEDQLQFSLCEQLDGMEVQQMAFDGERVRPKRWTIADVGHRLEALARNTQPRDVNAIGGNEFVVARKVDGWNRVLVAINATTPGGGGEGGGGAPQRAG